MLPSPASRVAPPVALGALVAATVYATGLSDGGFSPSSWGFAPALGVAAILGLLLRPVSLHLSWLQVAFLAGLVGLVGWTAVSLAWSADTTIGVQSVERDLAYALCVAAAIFCCGRGSCGALRAGILVGSVATCLLSVAAHLFPQDVGLYTSVFSPGRLYYPLGYWNAQGLLATFAVVLCAGVVAGSGPTVGRLTCAIAIPPLSLDCYLTLSRGAELALIVAVLIWLVADDDRVRSSVWVLLCTPAALLAIWQAHNEPSLFGPAYSLNSASVGRHVAWATVASAVGSGVLVGLATLADRHWRPRKILRVAYVGLWAALLVVGVAAALFVVGSPAQMVRSARNALTAPPASDQVDPSRMLSLSLNGRTALWDVAWNDATAHPVLGSGAGTYEQRWLKHRSFPGDSRWAHSLYLETLSETGLIGLIFLITALAAPVAAVVRSRVGPSIASLIGVYAAYLAHSAIDWDWQVPTVTLVALIAGVAILGDHRCQTVAHPIEPSSERFGAKATVAPWLRRVAAAGVLGLVVASSLGLAGNRALAESQNAAHRGDYGTAMSEGLTAAAWEPWSYLPWMAVGEARQAIGDTGGAAAAYRTATKRDSGRWDAWFALAGATHGAERVAALRRARALNPLSVQIAEFCQQTAITGCPRKAT